MQRAKRRSKMYKSLIGKVCVQCERTKSVHKKGNHFHCDHCGHDTPIRSKIEIEKLFHEKRIIRVFDWQSDGYEKDTLISAMDSIRYYKGLLRASMVSINPHNGFVKAWVGGANF